MKLLPHRYPFLLVDKIVEMDGDNSAVGIKNVSINEPFFQGHFPNFPVMPGVLLIEGMAQTAGALCVASLQEAYEPQLVYFMAIDRASSDGPFFLAIPSIIIWSSGATAGAFGVSRAERRSMASSWRKPRSAP